MSSSQSRPLPLPALQRALERPQPVHGFGARSPLHGLARRTVGFSDILAQSLAAVAPTGVAVTFPSIVLSQVGGPTLIAAVLAIAATLLVAMSVNEFARRMAVTGSLYTYATKAMGPAAGFLTSLALQLGYGFISIFAFASCVSHVREVIARLVGAPPIWSLMVLLLTLAATAITLSVRGVRLTLRILLVIEVATAAVVLVLTVALLVCLHGQLDWSLLVSGGATPKNIGAGAAVAMTAFVGFESSAALGAEARRPFADVPRALVWAVCSVGVLYFLAAGAQVAAFRSLNISVDPSASPTSQIAAAYGLGWIGTVLNLSVGVSFFACGTASTTALARVMFSLGREGVFPARLGASNARTRTPVAATVATAPLVAFLPAVALAAGASLTWIVETSLVVATVGYLAAYLMVCVAAPIFLHRLRELTWRSVASAVPAAVILAGVIGFYLVDEWSRPGGTGILVAAVGLVAGLGYYLWHVTRRPWVRDRIGVYDEPVVAEVLGAVASSSDSAAVA